MKTPRSASIHARISSDQTGEALGVTRQLEDCRRLAAEHGWTVGDEYVDNDVSAFRSSASKPLPEYQRLLADLAGGHRDAVLVYNLDAQTGHRVMLLFQVKGGPPARRPLGAASQAPAPPTAVSTNQTFQSA